MKRFVIFILLVYLAVAGYQQFAKKYKTSPFLNSKVTAIADKIKAVRESSVHTIEQFAGKYKDLSKALTKEDEIVTVYLKHGGKIMGRLLDKTDKDYSVEWNGEKFVIDAKQVKSIEYKKSDEANWEYKNYVVIKKTNGVVMDGRITAVTDDGVTVLFTEGGGELEMAIRHQDIDNIIFAPVCNAEASETEERLKKLFPKMKIYREGNVTIFTDSYATSVNQYRKAIRRQYTDLYLKFFRLFKDRQVKSQTFVVIFDDWRDYVEYAITDGVPGWIAIGYFSPRDKVLYLFNAFGEKMEKLVFDVIVGKSGKSFEDVVNSVKKHVDERYHEFIDAQAKEITDRYWNVYNLYKSELTDMTFSTLRHELTHEIFHNWALQNIVMSKINMDQNKMTEKKKEFLDAKDWKKKEELLKSLMRMNEEGPDKEIEMVAAQSWLAEGLATYAETEPFGSANEERLFTFQEMVKNEKVNPIDFLTSFEKGSFTGLTLRAKLDAYAESWAFTTFLVNKYPDEFMNYQRKLAENAYDKKSETDTGDDLALLLKCIGKDMPTLDKEFSAYMDTYAKVDDPDVKRYMRYYQIWADLMQSHL